ncbi:MAG: winged helix-turn-helix domain-containing protein [Rhodospirillum sp.]|nr:winged helix-turn-helix domain-containing protein [Rhodospirillum sp.]MCF8502616.1 winged helix-turn-helix domain-containing protein [Rhodospirillum sp.]
MTDRSHLLYIREDAPPPPALATVFERSGFSLSHVAEPERIGRVNGGNGHGHGVNGHGVSPSLVIFDTDLPPPGGMEALKVIHDQCPQAGIIILTAVADSVACILGLEMGADDVVERTRDPREVLARGKRLLTRLSEARDWEMDRHDVQFSGWVLDLNQRDLLSPKGESLRLTRGEFELLAALAAHPGQVMSRDALLDHVSHREWAPADRTVDVLVNRVRRKMGEDPKDPRHIVTVHGVGYVLRT